MVGGRAEHPPPANAFWILATGQRENPAMPRRNQERQFDDKCDQLASQYREIGIKAVAAAVEPGRKEEVEKSQVPGPKRFSSAGRGANDK